MKYVTPARNPECTPVYMPVYNEQDEVTNIAKREKTNSILGLIETKPTYTDIQGSTLKMVLNIHDEIYTDIVEVYGTTQSNIVVKIGEQFVSVYKSVAKFYLI